MNVLPFSEYIKGCKEGEGFQVLSSNRDEEAALLETLLSLDDYLDRKRYFKTLIERKGEYPSQIFFNTVFTENQGKKKKCYELYGITFEKDSDGLLLPDIYQPFSFDEVMEYYCGGEPFGFTELIGDTSNDVFSLL